MHLQKIKIYFLFNEKFKVGITMWDYLNKDFFLIVDQYPLFLKQTKQTHSIINLTHWKKSLITQRNDIKFVPCYNK